MIHIDWILAIVAGWLALGLGALFALHDTQVVARRLFPIGAFLGLALAGVALAAAFDTPEVAELAIGLPGLPMHLRLDALSAFFLVVIGAGAFGTSLFSAGYFRTGEGTPPGLLCLEYHVFLAAMAMVTLADDGYAFMVMWETMALASFFLVTSNHRVVAVREAAYLYLLIAHIGAIAILLCFGVLQANTGDYTFANLRAQHLDPLWSAIAFGFAVLGFGAKAGLVPLHVWLPEAHPAAPSPVSALMSAVMLKTAIYGLLRVTPSICCTAAPGGGAWSCWRWVLAAHCWAWCFPHGANRHETPAGVFVDREHRPHHHSAGPRADLSTPTACRALAALALTAALVHCLATRSSRACCSWAPARYLHATASATWASSAA
jgi:formate hydrogenlyase subunit 3/multisubunit Na+/H+ antiporter MnhD subunit